MLSIRAWLKTWIYLGCIFGWTFGARPQFDTSTNMGLVLVPADAEVDSVIFRLRATDQDADFPLIFDITAAVQPIVRVANLPCTLYNKVCQANVILTRRLVPGRLHDFAVRVRDSKGDSNSMQATISVTNATTPRDMIFPHVPSIIMVPEDTKPGKELDYLLVRANPWHGKPVYIELWQPKELFTIRQRQTPTQTRGVITLVGELDFETQSMYTLTMYATDPYTEPGKDTRNIAGVHVVVIVQDVQDVPPVFTLAPPLTRVNNSVKPGDVIMRVHAEDGDKGTPREVTYGLVSEGNPFTTFFNISESTGEIILARPLEELTQITHVGAPILLSVVAEEVRRSRDEPPGQATVVELGLLLGEAGNSPPYFESDSYVAWMDENAVPGTVVAFDKPDLAKVRDEDIGKTGVFALKLGNNNGTFEIMPSVAERVANFVVTVRDNTLMDYEVRKTLQFTIIAQEVGPATNLSASVPVVIFLRDINDNPPEFEKETYEVTIAENVLPGTRVVQVHASDKDTGLSGSIRYTRIIGKGSETLTMNPETGLIVVAKDTTGLDREMTASLQLLVEARDENGRGLNSTVPLIVNLLDINDNAPIFEKSIYQFVLNVDHTNFTSPAFIKAIDADAEPPNNEVRYELLHGNYGNKFYLNEITGELILREPLDKTRKRRNNAYVNFATKFRNEFLQTLNTFQEMGASTEKPLRIWKNRKKRADDHILYTLTVRAYDSGVPHRSSTAKVQIITAAPTGAFTLMLAVPGENLDPIRTTKTLAAITGGRVTIQEIRPYNQPNTSDKGTAPGGKMSLVVARVEPKMSGTFLVDFETIHKSLIANGMGIVPVENSNTNSAYPTLNGNTIGNGNGDTASNVGGATGGGTLGGSNSGTESGSKGTGTGGNNGSKEIKGGSTGSGTGEGKSGNNEGNVAGETNGGIPGDSSAGASGISGETVAGVAGGTDGGTAEGAGKLGTGTIIGGSAGDSGGNNLGNSGKSGSGSAGGIVLGTNPQTGVSVEGNFNKVNKTIASTENDYIVYKAENKLLLWLLILLGLLMLLGLLALILCCICPGCPFYMAPRKRRIHSFENLINPDNRPKRHLRRKQINPVEADQWSGKKLAWSADPMRRNWQFNRRNTKNRGLASLPGDVALIETPQALFKGPSLRLRDGPESWGLKHAPLERKDDRIYVEDVETGRVYDAEDVDSLRRHEMERGSDVLRQNYHQTNEILRLPREQHFYRDGNAEVLRLVTGGHFKNENVSLQAQRPTTLVSDRQVLGYRSDGKDIILRRFIEDQNTRLHEDLHGSAQEISADGLGSRPQGGEQYFQKHELIILPKNLDLDRTQHREEREPSVQRLIIDHGDVDHEEESRMRNQHRFERQGSDLRQQRKIAAAILAGTVASKAAEKPTTNARTLDIEQNASSTNIPTYTIHDIELAKQNALLAQLLMDRDVRHLGVPGLDPGSYLETQSLPSQVAIATQTDRTAATQTENRSRSDNEESEEEIRSRRKSKLKKRFGSEFRRSRSLWRRSPIQEESRSFSETRSRLSRRKAKETREGRRATLEPDVLREISDSLDEQTSTLSMEEGHSGDRQHRMMKKGEYRSEERDDLTKADGAQPSQVPDYSSPDTSKNKYHRRSHAKEAIGEVMQAQKVLEIITRKRSTPARSKTRLHKDDTKSAESKKQVSTNSDKKESDESSSKKKSTESQGNNTEIHSKKESEDNKKKKNKGSRLLEKVGLFKSLSEKSLVKNKSREKEETSVNKKRTMLRHQKAKKISTESSEFEDVPVKPRQFSLRVKPIKQPESTSGLKSKQDSTKVKGSSTLSDGTKSRSLATDTDRSVKRTQKQSDSSSSAALAKQEPVKNENTTSKKSDIEDTKENLNYEKKITNDPVPEKTHSQLQAEKDLAKASSSTVLIRENLKSSDDQVTSESTDPQILDKSKESPPKLENEILKLGTTLINDQLKSIAIDEAKTVIDTVEKSSKNISPKIDSILQKSSETNSSKKEVDQALTTGEVSHDSNRPPKLEYEIVKLDTDLIRDQLKPIISDELKTSTNTSDKSENVSPKIDPVPLKSSESSSVKKETDEPDRKERSKTTVISDKPIDIEALKSQGDTLLIAKTPEATATKILEAGEKITDSLETARPTLVPCISESDQNILLVKKEPENSKEDTVVTNVLIPEESKKENLDKLKPNIEIEQFEPGISDEKIHEKVKEISTKSNSEVIETVTDAVTDKNQELSSPKKITDAFLKSETMHGSLDSKVIPTIESKDHLVPDTALQSLGTDSNKDSQNEILEEGTSNSTNPVTEERSDVKTETSVSKIDTNTTDVSDKKDMKSPTKSTREQTDSFIIIEQPEEMQDTKFLVALKPDEEKRSDEIGVRSGSPRTESKDKLPNDKKNEQENSRITEGTSASNSAAGPLERSQDSTDKSPIPQYKSIDKEEKLSLIIKDKKNESKEENDNRRMAKETAKENTDGKSREKKSDHTSEDDGIPKTGPPSFYILSSTSSAEDSVPDREISQIQANPDETLSDSVSKFPETIVEKIQQRGSRDMRDDVIVNQTQSKMIGDPSDVQSGDWNKQQIPIAEVSGESLDNAQPYQTPRHRSKNRTGNGDGNANVKVNELASDLFLDESHFFTPVLKEILGVIEPDKKKPGDTTSEMKEDPLTPRLIAEEAIRSGLQEIIDSDELRRENSSQTSAKTSPENQSQSRISSKRKPSKESLRNPSVKETKKFSKEKTGNGIQSSKKVDETYDVARSIRPKTEPKGGNPKEEDTHPVRPRTQRSKVSDSQSVKPQEISLKDFGQEAIIRQSKQTERTRHSKQNSEEIKWQDSSHEKSHEGAIPKEGYMSRYKQKREEMERKRKELKEAAEERQRPRWQRKPIVLPPQRVLRKDKGNTSNKEKPKDGQTPEGTTPRTKRKIIPLANAESEQLRAMVKEGRKLRRAEGGDSDDPPVEIFATEPPPAKITPSFPSSIHKASYVYEKIPLPFYLHPPPPPQCTPQVSPLHMGLLDSRRPDDDLDSGIAVSLQGGAKLRHQQLLEKKSVFDIAYSDAAPSQLRTDSTTPPS